MSSGEMSAQQVVALARRLKATTYFAPLAAAEEEASTTANAVSDILQAAWKLQNEILPTLLDESSSAGDLNDAMLDFGEELRHILYHVRDAKFFSYLLEE